jgi:hypothetical protein
MFHSKMYVVPSTKPDLDIAIVITNSNNHRLHLQAQSIVLGVLRIVFKKRYVHYAFGGG